MREDLAESQAGVGSANHGCGRSRAVNARSRRDGASAETEEVRPRSRTALQAR
jgi:hypothetical protein